MGSFSLTPYHCSSHTKKIVDEDSSSRTRRDIERVLRSINITIIFVGNNDSHVAFIYGTEKVCINALCTSDEVHNNGIINCYIGIHAICLLVKACVNCLLKTRKVAQILVN